MYSLVTAPPRRNSAAVQGRAGGALRLDRDPGRGATSPPFTAPRLVTHPPSSQYQTVTESLVQPPAPLCPRVRCAAQVVARQGSESLQLPPQPLLASPRSPPLSPSNILY